MDWNRLQQKLYEIEPTNGQEDYAKLKTLANNGVVSESKNINYVEESVQVPQGSLELDRDYSISDFAKLAGIDHSTTQRLDEKTLGQRVSDTGVAKAFKRGWDNYNTINLDFDIGGGKSKKPNKNPTNTAKRTNATNPAQNIPRSVENKLLQTHKKIKSIEVAKKLEDIPAETVINDENNTLHIWNGSMWSRYDKKQSHRSSGTITSANAFDEYKKAAERGEVYVPRTPRSGITQPNVKENSKMEKDSMDDMGAKDNTKKPKINPMRLARFFGGDDTMLLARAINKMQNNTQLSRTEMGIVAGAFQSLLGMDKQQLRYLTSVLMQAAANKTNEAKKPKMPKERNPHARDLEALRKSGASGAHRDKKQELPRKAKHKKDISLESLKSDLEKLLNDKK